MLDFIKNYWTEILSVVGAAAWLPIILTPIINFFRPIRTALLDYRVLTNGLSTSVDMKETKKGTILLLVLNLFIKKTTLFARKIEITVELKNGGKLNADILDFSTITSHNANNTDSVFSVPVNNEFNVTRTLQPDIDNIKYLAILVESGNFESVDEILKIEMRLFYTPLRFRPLSKKIILTSDDFPKFNTARLLDLVEKHQQIESK